MTRHHCGSTRIVSRGVGVVRRHIDAASVPPARIVDRRDEVVSTVLRERARREAWMNDETAGWRYEPLSAAGARA